MTAAADGPRVRKARREDLARLRELWRQLDARHAEIQPGFFRLPREPRPASALEQALAGWDQVILVAEAGGGAEVVGAVAIKLFDTPPDPFKAAHRRGLVEDLIVDPAHRRRGIGAALMEAAASWCRGRGATQLVLTVWEGNDEAAAFYAALGYGPVSRVLGRSLDP